MGRWMVAVQIQGSTGIKKNGKGRAHCCSDWEEANVAHGEGVALVEWTAALVRKWSGWAELQTEAAVAGWRGARRYWRELADVVLPSPSPSVAC